MTNSPRYVRFTISSTPSSAFADRLHALSAALDATLRSQEGDVSNDEPVTLLGLLDVIPPMPTLTACLGMADDGHPLLLRLLSPDVAHVLVTGGTGAGKTELIRSMLVSLALFNHQSKLQLALIDSRRWVFVPLAGLSHVIDGGIVCEMGAVTALLEKLVAKMEQREAEGIFSPHIVVVVDELRDLQLCGPSVKEALTLIVQRGREVGIHLIASARSLDSVESMFGTTDFPVRLEGKEQGRGDFVASFSGMKVRFQAAWTTPDDWRQLME